MPHWQSPAHTGELKTLERTLTPATHRAAWRLMQSAMYTNMLAPEAQVPEVQRGMALHKVLRLVIFCLKC